MGTVVCMCLCILGDGTASGNSRGVCVGYRCFGTGGCLPWGSQGIGCVYVEGN